MTRRPVDIARGIAALAALAVLLVGVPVLLIAAVGWPLPRQVPRLAELRETFAGDRPLETATVWKALAVVCWLAWLQIVAAAVLEALATGRGALPRSVPGLHLGHGLVAPLIAAVVLALPAAPTTRAAAAMSPIAAANPPPTDSPAAPTPQPPPADARSELAPAPTATREHVVQRRETLWDLAEHYLGDGYRSAELFELNRGRPQPDGGALRDPGVIRPGWVLQIPAENPPPSVGESVTVERGDTLWDIAEDRLGDGHRYVEILDVNRGTAQPDGRSLADADVIEPGWVLRLPVNGSGQGDPAGTPTTTGPPAPVADTPAPPTSAITPPPPATVTAHTTATDATSEPTALADDADAADDAGPLAPRGLVGGGIATAGLLLVLERRRRAQQRRRQAGQVVPAAAPDAASAELALRAGADRVGAANVDRAIRAAAATSELPPLRRVEAADDVSFVLDTPTPCPPGFVQPQPDRWTTDDSDATTTRATVDAAAPAPTLVPVGVSGEGTEVLIDLENPPVTTVAGDADAAAALIRSMVVSAATAPWADHTQVVVVGDRPLPLDDVEVVDRLDDALDRLEVRAATVRDALTSARCTTIAEARAAGITPDLWAPTILLSSEAPHEQQKERLRALAADAPLGVAVVVASPADDDSVGRRIEVTGDGTVRVDGLELAAHLLGSDEAARAAELLDHAASPCVEAEARPEHRRRVPRSGASAASPLGELLAEVDVIVRVLGEVDASRAAPDGEERLVVGKQKSLEAIAYLALREGRVDREDLQAALWPAGANSTKTFHNTVWAARKALGHSRDGDDLFPEPAEGHYLLHDRVATDYGLFHELTARAEETDEPADAAELLSGALTLVRGEPFLGVGRGYAWVAPHAGLIVSQVVDAAEELAEMRLASGDWRAAEWAARQGLRVFPCEERLYRLLMRGAHAAGSLPGVQRAFQELAAAVADPDDGAEPEDTIHSETVALLEDLTGKLARHGRASA